jgi:predicted solute-binding protein
MGGRDRRARRVGRMLRVGCVKYLNARPLIRGWQGPAEFDHPSALCKRLANGELDVALVSSFEFLRNPIYRMVDDVSISSDGQVFSVVMAHRGEISQIEEIELDSASETAVNLLHCLLAELGLNARLVPKGEFETQMQREAPGRINARLFIGDQAIRFRQKYTSEFHFWDLGEQWKKLVDLPFVYALWLVRPEVADPKPIANHLRALRDENLANLDELIAGTVAGFADRGQWKELNQELLSRYYRDHLRFSFGEKEKQGLRAFANLCANNGLLPKRDLTFSLV